jgi:peroxiredoxin Q/BCP
MMRRRNADNPRPAVNDVAPDFELLTDGSKPWRLSAQRGNVAVLLFYPQDETLVCTRQLCSVRDHWERYLDTKAVIVGISPGEPEQHREFAAKRGLPLPLLADPDRNVTRQYLRYRPFPVSFLRGVVVVDADGVIRNIDVMLRAFRPRDEKIITDIYAARGDELNQKYENLRTRARSVAGRA